MARRYQREKQRRQRLAREAVRILLSRAVDAAARGDRLVEEACLRAIKPYQRKYHVRLTPREKMLFCEACFRVYPPDATRRVSMREKGLTLLITCPYCGVQRKVLLKKRFQHNKN